MFKTKTGFACYRDNLVSNDRTRLYIFCCTWLGYAQLLLHGLYFPFQCLVLVLHDLDIGRRGGLVINWQQRFFVTGVAAITLRLSDLPQQSRGKCCPNLIDNQAFLYKNSWFKLENSTVKILSSAHFGNLGGRYGLEVPLFKLSTLNLTIPFVYVLPYSECLLPYNKTRAKNKIRFR